MMLRGHSDEALLSDVRQLIGSQRELTARLIIYLAEIEHRRLHVVAGFSSMFDFSVKELRLSEGEAFRRLAAARLARRFPVVHTLIASGDVHLSALALLRPHLTKDNHVELLDAVRGKSKRDVEMLLAARFPQRDTPARVRAISPERFRIEFTASAERREKLERCLDLSSHANPQRDLAFVIERAVELLLSKLERERLGKAKRPRETPRDETPSNETPGTPPASRHIPTAARRSVFERDGSRCTYVSPDGHRCETTAFLELDHIVPHALGGANEPENLRVRCRAHNRLAAEQAFGRAHIDRAVHLRQRKYGVAENVSFARQKVVLALKQLGFRRAQALRAVCNVEKHHRIEEPQSLEAFLREALLEATKAA
jgi:5-methylcytosine-specific restriction endonuclease McrA